MSPCHIILNSCQLKQSGSHNVSLLLRGAGTILYHWWCAGHELIDLGLNLIVGCPHAAIQKSWLNMLGSNSSWPNNDRWLPNLRQPIIVSMCSHPVQPWMASLKFFHSWLRANQRVKRQNKLHCWRKVKLKLVLTYPGLTFAFPLGPAKFWGRSKPACFTGIVEWLRQGSNPLVLFSVFTGARFVWKNKKNMFLHLVCMDTLTKRAVFKYQINFLKKSHP